MSGFTITREDQQGSQVYAIYDSHGDGYGLFDSYASALAEVTRLTQRDERT